MGDINEPTASVAQTQEKAGEKPTAKPKPRVKQGPQFGDVQVSHLAIDPVPTNKRLVTSSEVFSRAGALALHPFSLALLSATGLVTSSPKSAVISSLLGFSLAAALVAILASATQRYGVSLSVLSRHVFGSRGSRVFAITRAVSAAGFLGLSWVSAASVLHYSVLCTFPRGLAAVQKIPSLAGLEPSVAAISGLGIALSVRFRAGRWHWPMWSSVLALILFFVVADVSSPLEWLSTHEGDATPSLQAVLLVFVGACSLLLMPLDRVRMHASAPAAMLAPLAWLAPWLVAAVSFAAMGSSLALSLVTDPAHAVCARLPGGAALLSGLLWSAALVLPMARIAADQVALAVEEMSGGTTKPEVKKAMRVLFFCFGALLAWLSRTSAGDVFNLGFALCCTVLVVICAFVAADFVLVRQGRTVLDDLYTLEGPHYGVLGVQPSGVLAWVVATLVAFLVRAKGGTGTTAFMAALLSGLVFVLLGGFATKWWFARKSPKKAAAKR